MNIGDSLAEGEPFREFDIDVGWLPRDQIGLEDGG